MPQQTLDLDQLNDAYDIIGELSERDDARTLMARRRDSGDDVLITILTTPAGDEGNALSHLASDAKRLADSRHRNLVRIIDGRWVGTDAFALVTERVNFPTLADVLVRRDEGFACPRVALILQEINATLEWARAEKIVNRALNLDSIYLEPGSDRVCLLFGVRALPLAEMPGPDSDARTIATLARAMLTRSVADPERDRLPLGEVRPGLPDRLIEQTEQILQLDRNARVPDMSEYIAIVAMSDNLKRSEMECAETTRKLLAEERAAREKLEGERLAAEKAAAEQARLFQQEREEFGREREKMLRAIEKERENVARERAALEQERADHQNDRALLLKEREEHKRWADEVERAFKAQKEAFAAEQEALREAAARATEGEVVRTPASGVAAIAMPKRPDSPRYKPEWQRKLVRAWSLRPKMHWNRRWNVPVAALGLVLLIALAALAITRGNDRRDTAIASAAPAQQRIVDSVAGGVATPTAPAPSNGGVGIPQDFINSVAGGNRSTTSGTTGVPADFLRGVAARVASPASTQPPPAASGEARTPRPPIRTPSTARREAPAPARQTVRTDTMTLPTLPGAVLLRRDTVAPPDTLPPRDTSSRNRPDTIPARVP